MHVISAIVEHYTMSTSTTSLIRYDDEIKRRLEKLSRTYDLTTMKIFIAVECLGECNV